MKKRSKSKSEFQLVSANFRIRAEWKKVMSRAELKILQHELWLKPARLGLITKLYTHFLKLYILFESPNLDSTNSRMTTAVKKVTRNKYAYCVKYTLVQIKKNT